MSHKHRFIFLHSRKTAGSSVTLSLLRYLEHGDQWLNAPAYGIMNDALLNGFVPVPVKQSTVLATLEERQGKALVKKLLAKPRRLDRAERLAVADAYNSHQLPHPTGGWQHVVASQARQYLGPEVWDNYFKFSFERNPWDRMASLYWWRMRDEAKDGEPSISFRDFIRAIKSGDREVKRAHRAYLNSNWPIYAIKNQLAVDHLCRFEDLADELRYVLDKVGLEFDGWLPQSKHRTRRSSSLDELYDEETTQLVGEIFHREIAQLGYRPPR